jgi:hypothetical protein
MTEPTYRRDEVAYADAAVLVYPSIVGVVIEAPDIGARFKLSPDEARALAKALVRAAG